MQYLGPYQDRSGYPGCRPAIYRDGGCERLILLDSYYLIAWEAAAHLTLHLQHTDNPQNICEGITYIYTCVKSMKMNRAVASWVVLCN